MKIIITSDVHGHLDRLHHLVTVHPDADYYLDAGDSEGSETSVHPFLSVEGNNDRLQRFPKTRVIDAHDHKIYMTHSHEFYPSQRDDGLIKKAQRLGCDLVIYGHSHVPDVRTIHGVTLINPGSLYYNRDRSPLTYVILTIDESNVKIQHVPYR